MAKSIKWKGGSGKTYEYWIHPIGADFKDEPGNYIYAAETQPHCWQAVYIGQTSSLSERLADHEKEACATRNSATHIHAHTTSGGERKRLAEENDLIKKRKPVCNG